MIPGRFARRAVTNVAVARSFQSSLPRIAAQTKIGASPVPSPANKDETMCNHPYAGRGHADIERQPTHTRYAAKCAHERGEVAEPWLQRAKHDDEREVKRRSQQSRRRRPPMDSDIHLRTIARRSRCLSTGEGVVSDVPESTSVPASVPASAPVPP